MPRERPAHRAATGHAARADRHVGRLATHRIERRQEPRDVGGIVAEVGVHVDGDLEATALREAKALKDRAAEPAPAAAHEHVHPRVLLRCAEGDLACAVGRTVVDDEQLQIGIGREHGVDQRGDVFPLIVGGRLHQHPAGRPIVAGMEVIGHGRPRYTTG